MQIGPAATVAYSAQRIHIIGGWRPNVPAEADSIAPVIYYTMAQKLSCL